jgi:biopolymer transport protein ExbD
VTNPKIPFCLGGSTVADGMTSQRFFCVIGACAKGQKAEGSISWLYYFQLWILGVLISLFISLTSVLRITFTLRNAQKLGSGSYSKYVMSRKINVHISHHITMPITIVFFPNRIFVPAEWNEWNDQCRNNVLRHEQIHLHNHDNLIQIIQVLAQAIFFFHPLVYLLNKKMNLYREMACDDGTIRIGKSTPLEYSKCLTDIAERAVWTPTMWRSSSAFINQKSDLSHRIKYQIKEVTMSGISKKFKVFIVIILLLSIPVFSVYVGSADADPIAIEKIANEDILTLQITSTGTVETDKLTLNISELEKLLRESHAENEYLIVTIKAENDVIYKDFIMVLDEVRKSQSKRVLIYEYVE